MGLILSCYVSAAYVSAASMRDEWGAVWALDALKWRGSRLRLLRADAGYPGGLASWAWRVLGCLVEIVCRPKGQRGFVVLKGRWVIERTFGWLGRSRRLSKDYEETPESSRGVTPVGHDSPDGQKIASPTCLNTASEGFDLLTENRSCVSDSRM